MNQIRMGAAVLRSCWGGTHSAPSPPRKRLHLLLFSHGSISHGAIKTSTHAHQSTASSFIDRRGVLCLFVMLSLLALEGVILSTFNPNPLEHRTENSGTAGDIWNFPPSNQFIKQSSSPPSRHKQRHNSWLGARGSTLTLLWTVLTTHFTELGSRGRGNARLCLIRSCHVLTYIEEILEECNVSVASCK